MRPARESLQGASVGDGAVRCPPHRPLAGGPPESLGLEGIVLGVDPRGRTLVYRSFALDERFELWLMRVGPAR